MFYYQSKSEISKLGDEFNKNFRNPHDAINYITIKYNFVEFGLLTSTLKDSIWVGVKGNKTKDNQFKVSADVMDFIVNSGIYNNSVNNDNLIKLFGKLYKGKIVDLVGLNLEST